MTKARTKRQKKGREIETREKEGTNLQSSRQRPRVLEIGEDDPLVAVESEVEEVEVLAWRGDREKREVWMSIESRESDASKSDDETYR